jgi:hypothetical protein
MESTPILNVPLVPTGQASARIIHNEALAVLGAMCLGRGLILSREESSPPGGESDGDAYALGSSPGGAWADQADKIALWNNGWVANSDQEFMTPETGMLAHDANTGHQITYQGNGNWIPWDYEYQSQATTFLSSTTMSGVADFTIPVIAGQHHIFEYHILYSGVVGLDIKLGCEVTNTGGDLVAAYWANPAGAADYIRKDASSPVTYVTTGFSIRMPVIIRGSVYGGTADGELRLWAAKVGTGKGSTSLLARSTLRCLYAHS